MSFIAWLFDHWRFYHVFRFFHFFGVRLSKRARGADHPWWKILNASPQVGPRDAHATVGRKRISYWVNTPGPGGISVSQPRHHETRDEAKAKWKAGDRAPHGCIFRIVFVIALVDFMLMLLRVVSPVPTGWIFLAMCIGVIQWSLKRPTQEVDG